MKIFFSIIHPAHVHFFADSILELKKDGHEVTVISRDKECVLELLQQKGIKNICLSKARTGYKLIFEMLWHQFRLFFLLLIRRPQAIVALGGPLCAHVGSLFSRVLIFTDTHIAETQNRITFPFASKIIVPSSYPKEYIMNERFYSYKGYHELAYLDLDQFNPDNEVLQKLGLEKEENFFLVRLTAWNSSHDFGVNGLSLEQRNFLINFLNERGKVFISSEDPLPKDLEKFNYTLQPSDLHSVIYFSDLVIGESATLVSEAAVLGVPGIYISPIPRCYTDEQERKTKYIKTFTPSEFDIMMENLDQFLQKNKKINLSYDHENLLRDTAKMTSLIKESILEANLDKLGYLTKEKKYENRKGA